MMVFMSLFLVEFDANLTLCNTQQRYSPLGEGESLADAQQDGDPSVRVVTGS